MCVYVRCLNPYLTYICKLTEMKIKKTHKFKYMHTSSTQTAAFVPQTIGISFSKSPYT